MAIVVVVAVTKDSNGQSVGPAVQGPTNVVVVVPKIARTTLVVFSTTLLG